MTAHDIVRNACVYCETLNVLCLFAFPLFCFHTYNWLHLHVPLCCPLSWECTDTLIKSNKLYTHRERKLNTTTNNDKNNKIQWQ